MWAGKMNNLGLLSLVSRINIVHLSLVSTNQCSQFLAVTRHGLIKNEPNTIFDIPPGI